MQIQKDNGASPRRHLLVMSAKSNVRPSLVPESVPRQLRTALVNMPFVSTLRPSVQLGLLKAIGARHGFSIETFHLNLDFCAQLGNQAYEALCHHRGRMFGDWIFSLAAFGEHAPDPEDTLVRRFPKEVGGVQRAAGLGDDGLRKLRREEVPRFLAHVIASVPWRDFDVVGFTSTFEQTVAAAALARQIRAIHPAVRIIFGGANLDGDMGKEVVRTFPVIDYGVSGEADTAFPALLRAIAEGEPSDIPGVIWRKDGQLIANPPSAPLNTMDDLPIPEYDEYFERAQRLQLLPPGGARDVRIPFESSRGCWWGAKHHCTFAVGPRFGRGARLCFHCYFARRLSQFARDCRPYDRPLSARVRDCLERIATSVQPGHAQQLVVQPDGHVVTHWVLPLPSCLRCFPDWVSDSISVEVACVGWSKDYDDPPPEPEPNDPDGGTGGGGGGAPGRYEVYDLEGVDLGRIDPFGRDGGLIRR